jgi:hypothetical protein
LRCGALLQEARVSSLSDPTDPTLRCGYRSKITDRRYETAPNLPCSKGRQRQSGGGESVEWSSETQVSDSEWQLTVTFSESGLYALNCFDTADGEHDGAGLDYATTVTVGG